MRKIRFAALFAFAALAATPRTARADINRATEWQDVPPGATVGDVLLDAGVSEEITNAVHAAIFDPANTNLAASAGKDFLDAADGEDENAAIAIGNNASAAVTDEAITNAPGAVTHLRSAGVAIGPYAEVRNDSQPWKVQGVAIGWHAQATEINTLAIGAGAQHTNETAMTGDATVAAAPQANAFGYNAKATAFRATQIGQGVNSTSNSLQFLDVPIVRDGRLAVDEAGIVNAASNAIVNAGFAKGSYFATNTYTQTTVSWDTDDENGRLQIRKILDDTDPVALQWTMGTNQTVEIYSKQSIDSMTNEMVVTRQIVATWENFLDGSNVVFSITNYISGTYSLDAAKMRILELRDGEYREVYNSRDEILLHIQDFKDNDFKTATNQVIGAVNTAIENKADRDWGKYTSAGGEAPSNTVYMTAPNTVFAGGLEYERVAVGEGTICVLTTRGAPVWTQGDEGTFKFQDDGGTNYFGFAKTDSYTIGANTDGITVSGDMVTMTYNITMSGRPCVWYKEDLTSDTPWEQLNLPDGTATPGASHGVIWENNPPAGTQVCYINVGSAPKGFFRATIEVAGEAKFMTNMPADLSGGIICTNTATGVNGVIKPTFNGSTVIWNWSAQE